MYFMPIEKYENVICNMSNSLVLKHYYAIPHSKIKKTAENIAEVRIQRKGQ